MWISRKDWNELLEIQRTAITAFEQWQATHAAQLKALTEGQDRLMQSHAALEESLRALECQVSQALGVLHDSVIDRLELRSKEIQLNCAAWNDSSQAMLDTLAQRQGDNALAIRALLTALERKIDLQKPSKIVHSANGKRKR